MRVREIMNQNTVTLSVDETFGNAFRLLLDKRIRSLPVVDAAGVYRGIFDLLDVWEVLLPKAVTIHAGSLPNLAFTGNAPEQLRQKLAEAEHRPVTEFLDNEAAPSVTPDAALMEAMLLLYRQRQTLPVVEAASGKLVGIVAAWDILDRLG